MEAQRTLPLIVILGPTASGKSSVAIDIAEHIGGEIICADSRTVYKGMDIGTAKPNATDQARVPHWGLDLVEPNEYFSVADFKEYANKKIVEIRKRGHIPILVGGTGLYLDGIIFDYQFLPVKSAQRSLLESMTLDELHQYCIDNNIKLPENEKNKRYVIREIERKNVTGKGLSEPIQNCIIVGITTEMNILEDRIAKRSEQLFDDGVIDEARALGVKYGWESEAMKGNVYRLVHEFLLGNITKAELKERNRIADRQLAKRQLTWFKRNQFITWLSLEHVEQFVLDRLALVNK